MRILQLAVMALAVILAGCSANRARVVAPPDKPRLDRPDFESLKKCDDPVALPSGDMTQDTGERLWKKDRFALVVCGRRNVVLGDYIIDRDTGLAGDVK